MCSRPWLPRECPSVVCFKVLLRIPPLRADPSPPARMQSLTAEEALLLPVEDVLGRLGSDPATGLSFTQVEARRAYHGDNVLKSEDPEPLWKKFLEQFKEPMILLLLASASVSMLLGQFDDAISITLVRSSVHCAVCCDIILFWKSTPFCPANVFVARTCRVTSIV